MSSWCESPSGNKAIGAQDAPCKGFGMSVSAPVGRGRCRNNGARLAVWSSPSDFEMTFAATEDLVGKPYGVEFDSNG
jgi:hypothetical protein